MAYNNGGQICIDSNGAIFPRYGSDILRAYAMVKWEGMIVLACGNGKPCLVYLKKSSYREKGTISGGTSPNNPIVSYWTSKTYGGDDDRRKKLTRLEVLYYDDHDYVHHATSSGFTIQYRVDDETTSTQEPYTGDYFPSFTDIDTIELSTTTTEQDRTHLYRVPIELDKEGRVWQFRITSNYDFRILGFKPYLKPVEELVDE